MYIDSYVDIVIAQLLNYMYLNELVLDNIIVFILIVLSRASIPAS